MGKKKNQLEEGEPYFVHFSCLRSPLASMDHFRCTMSAKSLPVKNSFPFSHSFYSITDQGLICHSPPIYVVLHLQKIIKIIPFPASVVKNLYPTTVKVNAKTNRRPPKECIVLRYMSHKSLLKRYETLRTISCLKEDLISIFP